MTILRHLRGAGRWATLLLVSGTALAEPPPDNPPSALQTARELFDKASRARQDGRFGDCVEHLQMAIALKDTPGLRFHLAHCEEQLGHWTRAVQQYDRASSLIASGISAPDVEERLAATRLHAMDQIAEVRLVLGPVASARLFIDDQKAQDLGANPSVALDPGSHRLRLVAAGYRPYEQTLELTNGQRLQLRVPWEKETVTRKPTPAHSSPPQPLPATTEPRWSALRQAALVTSLGAVAAGAGVGIGFALKRDSLEDSRERLTRRIDRIDDSRGACVDPDDPELSGLCGDLAETTRQSDRAARVFTLGFVVAGAGVLGGLGVWLLWPTETHSAWSLQPQVGLDRSLGVEFNMDL